MWNEYNSLSIHNIHLSFSARSTSVAFSFLLYFATLADFFFIFIFIFPFFTSKMIFHETFIVIWILFGFAYQKYIHIYRELNSELRENILRRKEKNQSHSKWTMGVEFLFFLLLFIPSVLLLPSTITSLFLLFFLMIF